MSLILIKCPQTGRTVSTGIEMDRHTFDSLPNVGTRTRCPACAETHTWHRSEAWLSDDGEGYKKQPGQ